MWSQWHWRPADDTLSGQLEAKHWGCERQMMDELGGFNQMKWDRLRTQRKLWMMMIMVLLCKCVYQCHQAWRPGQSDAPSWRTCFPTVARPTPPSTDLTNRQKISVFAAEEKSHMMNCATIHFCCKKDIYCSSLKINMHQIIKLMHYAKVTVLHSLCQ